MSDCIFCKIINKELDSVKVWEDENFLAILDVCPNTKGMTLVIPKKHFDSYYFEIDDPVYLEIMNASKKVVKILEKGLKVNRVAMVMEGLGVNHLHIKLYPLYGVEKDFKAIKSTDTAYFEKYLGYISTQVGEFKDIDSLKELAQEILS